MSGVVTKYNTRNEKNNNEPVVNTKSGIYDTEDSLEPIRYAAQKVQC